MTKIKGDWPGFISAPFCIWGNEEGVSMRTGKNWFVLGSCNCVINYADNGKFLGIEITPQEKELPVDMPLRKRKKK